MGKRFHFFKEQDEETAKKVLGGTSKIMNIPFSEVHGDVLCLGQLKTLFGEPLYITKDMENQYSYCILAEDDEGTRVFLDAYSGPTGPAVGGKQDEVSRAAAKELAELIKNVKPSDYDWEGYYIDGPCEIKMGVRKGKPYCKERKLDEAELEEIDWGE